MDKVVIFGGTGFIGQSLAEHLSNRGFTPILIARNEITSPFKFVKWDVTSVGEWAKVLENAKAIVNLTGRSVNCIKTPENRDVILRSRVDATKTIGRALKTVENPPKIWIQMSTAHIYGDPPTAKCTEESSFGYGFAPFIAREWEKEFLLSKPDYVRHVRLRTSFVIGKNGGALKGLKQISKLGLGGMIGNGKQGISWIHEFDMNEIILQAIIDEEYKGVYIVSSPNPVTNKHFMKLLRKAMKIPFGLPAPKFLARLGAHFIFKSDPELAIYGRYVYPKKLQEQGYTFKFPDLETALNDLIH